MTTVNYTQSSPYLGNRPYGDVVLHGPNGSTTYKALVDTGADYLQLPQAAAALVGLSMANATTKKITTAWGHSPKSLQLLSNVSVDVEGVSVNVDVLFHPSPTSRPLLGRQALLRALEAGFNKRQWLWL